MATKLTAANAAESINGTIARDKLVEHAAPVHKRVRLSVDIDPEPYRQLVSLCQDIALKLGRARINHVWVLREVIEELLTDKGLQTRVINRVSSVLEENDRMKSK